MNANNISKRLLIVDCLKIPINTNEFKLYQICGNLVCKVQKTDYYLLSFDDGTGVINCKIFKDEVYDSICEKLDFGDCCIIEGELISDYSSTQPVINVYHIAVKPDRNFELEFKLHCIYLKKLNNKEQRAI